MDHPSQSQQTRAPFFLFRYKAPPPEITAVFKTKDAHPNALSRTIFMMLDTHAHTQTRTHTPLHTRTHSHTHVHTRTRTHTHTRTNTHTGLFRHVAPPPETKTGSKAKKRRTAPPDPLAPPQLGSIAVLRAAGKGGMDPDGVCCRREALLSFSLP